MTVDQQSLWQRLLSAKKPALLTHRNPDADTLGSALALYHALERCGVRAVLVACELPLAPKFHFLPGIERFKAAVPKDCDLLVAIDSGDAKLLIPDRPDVEMIVIDHHESNRRYGSINLVRPECGATAEVVADLLEAVGVKLNAKIAAALYAALASDTRFFTTDRVGAGTFRRAAQLLEAGADAEAIGNALARNRSMAELRLTGRLLSAMTLHGNGRIAAATVTRADLAACGAELADTADLPDLLLSAVTAEAAVLVVELPGGRVKGSLRAKGALNVSHIAARFGGGGHPKAAGFALEGEAQRVMQEAIALMANAL